ncbi:hypothetical protein K7640_27685 [Micromonospora sp. PLK6-60]|uniref:metallophosphoesterase n=1 Tax=Micromonospora sp. PLK6-60 TaxID=2873383 RepID=UPI001CA6FD57|nr:metallophosphoesterase [Micromonospora sp. PLK6-60]MBY8875616.1 hypothetical protein [Micromonospora sp. PLK6-60]
MTTGRRRLAAVVAAIGIALGGAGAGNPAAHASTTTCGDQPTEWTQRCERPTSSWLALSDVHFDPFAGLTTTQVDQLAATPPDQWGGILAQVPQQPSGYGSDTNYALLASALTAMRSTVAYPPAVVISGDFLSHNFKDRYFALATDKTQQGYDRFADSTVDFLADTFDRVFPYSQFLVTLGNNDTTCGDYELTPHSEFLRNFAEAWEPLVNRAGRSPSFAKSFPQLGSYQAELPTGGQAVVLNDVYLSSRYQNRCGVPGEDPAAETLQWLADTAQHLPRDERAWLVTHIPFGIDVFGTLSAGQPVGLMNADDQARLLGILHGRQWQLTVTGHLHMSTYRLATGQQPVPAMVVPSISPLFNNNPAYYVLAVTARGGVADYTAYAFDLQASTPTWNLEYSFNQTYGLAGFDASNLAQLQIELNQNADLRDKYIDFYNSGSGIGGITPSTFHAYWCGAVAVTAAEYADCTRPGS